MTLPCVLLWLQVVSIIESRARAVDLMSHNYYELLYAFHINRHNYRKGERSLGLCHILALCLEMWLAVFLFTLHFVCFYFDVFGPICVLQRVR